MTPTQIKALTLLVRFVGDIAEYTMNKADELCEQLEKLK